MDELKMLRAEDREWDTASAVHKLRPEIRAAAAQIRKHKQERLQLIGFLAAALAFLIAALCVIMDFRANGALTELSQRILIGLGAGGALSLAFAPVLAYFAEEDTNYEGA